MAKHKLDRDRGSRDLNILEMKDSGFANRSVMGTL